MIRLSVEQFGKQLIATGDLDPIYIMLVEAVKHGVLSDIDLKRWCLAFWFFYHAGVASELATAKDFWTAMVKHAVIPSGLRGTERRHFRAEKAISAIDWMRRTYPRAEDAIDSGLLPMLPKSAGLVPFSTLAKRVQAWPQFGPWIAFKIADMIDRVLNIPVDFSDCELSIYEEPLKGGFIIAQLGLGADFESAKQFYSEATPEERRAGMSRAIKFLSNRLGKIFAPPLFDRRINIQEIETVMCKYKSHLNGRYEIDHDTLEIRAALEATGGKLATKLVSFLPATP